MNAAARCARGALIAAVASACCTAALAVSDAPGDCSTPAGEAAVLQPRLRSALRTPGLPRIGTVALLREGDSVTVLTWTDPAGITVKLLALSDSAGSSAASPSYHVQWCAQHTPSGRLASIAALEEAYAMVFQLSAMAAYSFHVEGAGVDPAKAPTVVGSQAAVLLGIAAWRGVLVSQAQADVQAPPFRPWYSVVLQAADAAVGNEGFAGPQGMAVRRLMQQVAPDPHAVAVTVLHEAVPLPEGVSMSFSREPHHACSAPVDRQGRAACQLYDQHGHDNAAHANQTPARTVATFSGVVRPEAVVLPTTLVY